MRFLIHIYERAGFILRSWIFLTYLYIYINYINATFVSSNLNASEPALERYNYAICMFRCKWQTEFRCSLKRFVYFITGIRFTIIFVFNTPLRPLFSCVCKCHCGGDKPNKGSHINCSYQKDVSLVGKDQFMDNFLPVSYK